MTGRRMPGAAILFRVAFMGCLIVAASPAGPHAAQSTQAELLLRQAEQHFERRAFAEAAAAAHAALILDPRRLEAWKIEGLGLQLSGHRWTGQTRMA